MSAHTLQRPAVRGVLLVLASGLAAALAALAVTAIAGLVTGRDRGHARHEATPVYTEPGGAFRVTLPAGWRPLPSASATALRSADGRALVVVRPAPAIGGSPKAIAQGMTKSLRSRFHGFHPIAARVARVRGGTAFVYTFVRAPRGTVQSLALAPAHGRAWEIDAVVRAGDSRAARQAAAIVASFGP